MQAACTAAEIRTIVTSRAFVEQAKLADKLAGLPASAWSTWKICATADRSCRQALADGLCAPCFPRPCPAGLTGGCRRGAVHLRLRRQAQGRGAVAPGDPRQHRADPRGDRLLGRRQGAQCAADLPLLRPHRRHAAAGAHRRQPLPLSVAAALPGHPGTGLRPQLHGAVRHHHLPRQLRQVRPSLRLLPPALRRRRRREAGRAGARPVVREIRHAHLRRLRRHRDGAGAGGEHADGLPHRHRRQLLPGIEAQLVPCRASSAAACCTCAAPT